MKATQRDTITVALTGLWKRLEGDHTGAQIAKYPFDETRPLRRDSAGGRIAPTGRHLCAQCLLFYQLVPQGFCANRVTATTLKNVGLDAMGMAQFRHACLRSMQIST